MSLSRVLTAERRRERSRQQAPGATGPGATGRLMDDPSPTARVLLDGEVYGPVPVVPFGDELAEEGTRVFLHLDMRGQPIYAQALPS